MQKKTEKKTRDHDFQKNAAGKKKVKKKRKRKANDSNRGKME